MKQRPGSTPGCSRGPLCPICGERESRVIDSRPRGDWHRRRRECPAGHRFTTREEAVGFSPVEPVVEHTTPNCHLIGDF